MSFSFVCYSMIISIVCIQEMIAYNYCNPKKELELCGKGRRHFVCNPSELPQGSKFITMVPMTNKLRNFFLDRHNVLRNKCASGTETGMNGVTFKAATRMRNIIWDAELALSARVHCTRCIMQHNKCHNTDRFKTTGQNLAMHEVPKNYSSMEIAKLVEIWYDEKEFWSDPDMKYRSTNEGEKEFRHFTLFVNDKISRVGCSMSICEKDEKRVLFYVACNYDYTNIVGSNIYQVGEKSASKCKDWNTSPHPDYEHLCYNTGEIFPAHQSRPQDFAMGATLYFPLICLYIISYL